MARQRNALIKRFSTGSFTTTKPGTRSGVHPLSLRAGTTIEKGSVVQLTDGTFDSSQLTESKAIEKEDGAHAVVSLFLFEC